MPIAPACNQCGEAKTPRNPSADGASRWRCLHCTRAYQREQYRKDPEKIRARKRLQMANARRNPATRERYLGYQRKAWENGGREKNKQRMERMRVVDRWRWKRLTIHTKLTAAELESMWNEQQGLCGLTGRQLDFDTAHLDHIVPRTRGGSDERGNLRWTTKEANEAKGNLLDEEFMLLCTQIAEYIGRRLMEATATEKGC